MSDEEDPEFYRDMSTSELIHRQRDASKWSRDLSKEWDKTPHWDEEEKASISERLRRASNYYNAIQKELDRQKEVGKSGLGNLGKAVDSWFSKQQLQPPTVLNLNFSVRDHKYSARYYPDTGKLDVSIEVEPGTPGAKRQGNRYLMPCRNLDDYKAAEVAEKSRPN